MNDTDMYKSPTRKVFKVCELTGEIRNLLERQFLDVWVEGEISDLRNPGSGHLYFTLKDTGARLKTVIFKSHLRFLRFIPKEGEHVLIRGHLGVYEPRGEYQLICDYIEPKGEGAMQAAFEALKKKLDAEGLFDSGKKKPLPVLPVRIGVITSPSGAAIQDIIKVIDHGGFRCHLFLYPVRVQGWGASDEIAKALDEMNRFSENADSPLDVVLLTRGGGSLEDLYTFNEVAVAYAISRSALPVISAIGHETDTTIADYVADIRAATPSSAAEAIVQRGLLSIQMFQTAYEKLLTLIRGQLDLNRNQLIVSQKLLSNLTPQIAFLNDRVEHLRLRLNQTVVKQLEGYKNTIEKAQQGLEHLSPARQLADFRRQFEQSGKRLKEAGYQLVQRDKYRLKTTLQQLNLVSPLNILERGYSITRKLPLLEVVRESSELHTGDRLHIKLHSGSLICRTEEIKND